MKPVFALAFALHLLSVPLAEADTAEKIVTIYGSLRPEVIARFPQSGDSARRMDDGYSRVGIKGTAELGDDLSGFYKYERRVSANDGEDAGATRGDHNELRQVHAGLSGSFGALSIGRHYGLYYDYIDDELDRHRSHYSDAIVFGDLFVSDALVYRSPEFGGGNFGLLVQFNDVDALGAAVDERIEVAGSYRYNGIALHAGYVNSPTHEGLFGLAASYRYQRLNLVGVYQRIEPVKDAEQTLASLGADVDLTALNSVRLTLTTKTDGSNKDLDQVYLILGGDHQFSEHFMLFVEFFRKSTEVAQANDESALVSGFRFDF